MIRDRGAGVAFHLRQLPTLLGEFALDSRRAFPLLFIGLILFAASELSFANDRNNPPNCPIPPADRPDVPECPPEGTMLPETFPAAAVVLSDDVLNGNNQMRSEMGINRHQVVGDKALSILRASGAHPPVLFLSMEADSIRAIEQRIRREAPDRATQARWLAALRRTGAQSFNWQQDIMQPYFDPSTGRPVIRGVNRYVNAGFNANASLEALRAAAAQCGVTVGQGLVGDGTLQNGHTGGNIEAYPGGNCVLGTNHLSGHQWTQYSSEACGGQRPLQIDTSFMTVGHTDEIFSVVPSNQSRCGFAVMVASPRLGLELLERNRQQTMLNWQRDVSPEHRRGRMSNFAAWRDVCRRWQESRDAQRERSPGGTRGSRTNGFRWLWSPHAAQAGLANRDDEDSGDNPHSPSPSSPSPAPASALLNCEDMTNADLLAAMDMPSRESNGTLREYNMAIQSIMDRNVEALRARLRETNNGCDVPFIEVPNLFHGRMQGRGAEARPTSAEGIFSNPTNGLNITGRFIFPDPGNEAFRRELDNRMRAHGVGTDHIDMTYAHVNQGNLHCSSNVLRYCRPRANTRSPAAPRPQPTSVPPRRPS